MRRMRTFFRVCCPPLVGSFVLRGIACGFLLLLVAPMAHGWGSQGHRIIAAIALHYLHPSVREQVMERLGPISMEDASVWADKVKYDPQYAHTRSWHFTSIPDNSTYAESRLLFPRSDIITAIAAQMHTLQQATDADSLTVALKFLIHFVGDCHQPLHVGNGKDRGGNTVIVRFFGEKMSLHALWDTELIRTHGGGVQKWVQLLSTPHTPSAYAAWTSSNSLDWIQESYAYRGGVYVDVPTNSASSARYYRKHLPFVKQRLLQAGVRLAGLLNTLYREP